MSSVRVYVYVDENGNVGVTRVPYRKLKLNEDMVRFLSNRPDTAIKFTKSSPFAELGKGRVLKGLKPAKGPFKVSKMETTNFQCGHIVGGSFKQWSLVGGDIPLPC